MLNIYIKSYNRVFYLDRCIRSILQNVDGSYSITILDDGTPSKYLQKIQKLHPGVKIVYSDNYKSKSKSVEENIQTGKPIDSMEIPTDMWVNEVKKSDKYILMTEDDVWFIKKINIQEIIIQMRDNRINLVKLAWLGNYKDDLHLKIENISDLLNRTIPKKIFTANQYVMDLFIYNKYKFFTILYKLGLVDNLYKRKYWALNSILMGVYDKDYWLFIWKDARGKVDEKQQLRNAAVWYHKHKNNENLIARTREEFMKTTFQSSATNSYHKYGFDFDVNYFNYKMNEAWYKEEFDSMQNFPHDFTMEYFERFFDEKINKTEFRKWVDKFKDQYRANGAQVD